MKSLQRVWILWYGQFWQFIHHLLKQYAPHITVRHHDIHDSDDNFKGVCNTDILFLAVPIRAFEETVSRVISHTHQETLLVEVCTVKVFPNNVLRKHAANHKYLSTHPMFGPYSYQKLWSLKDLRVVITDHTLTEEMMTRILQLFQLLQLRVIQMSAQKHDQLLAQTLFLTHYITQTVIEADLTRTDIDTVSFGNLMDVIESVMHDKELFEDVWTYNPYCEEVLSRFHHAQKAVEKNLISAWKLTTAEE